MKGRKDNKLCALTYHESEDTYALIKRLEPIKMGKSNRINQYKKNIVHLAFRFDTCQISLSACSTVTISMKAVSIKNKMPIIGSSVACCTKFSK